MRLRKHFVTFEQLKKIDRELALEEVVADEEVHALLLEYYFL